MGEAAVRAIDLATMGCTWVLDVSALDPDEADAMAHRWQRCVDLLAAPDRLRLVDEPIRVRVHAGDIAPVLRTGSPAILTRVHDGACLLDPRCIPASADDEVIAACREAGVTLYLTGTRHFAH